MSNYEAKLHYNVQIKEISIDSKQYYLFILDEKNYIVEKTFESRRTTSYKEILNSVANQILFSIGRSNFISYVKKELGIEDIFEMKDNLVNLLGFIASCVHYPFSMKDINNRILSLLTGEMESEGDLFFSSIAKIEVIQEAYEEFLLCKSRGYEGLFYRVAEAFSSIWLYDVSPLTCFVEIKDQIDKEITNIDFIKIKGLYDFIKYVERDRTISVRYFNKKLSYSLKKKPEAQVKFYPKTLCKKWKKEKGDEPVYDIVGKDCVNMCNIYTGNRIVSDNTSLNTIFFFYRNLDEVKSNQYAGKCSLSKRLVHTGIYIKGMELLDMRLCDIQIASFDERMIYMYENIPYINTYIKIKKGFSKEWFKSRNSFSKPTYFPFNLTTKAKIIKFMNDNDDFVSEMKSIAPKNKGESVVIALTGGEFSKYLYEGRKNGEEVNYFIHGIVKNGKFYSVKEDIVANLSYSSSVKMTPIIKYNKRASPEE